MERRVWSCIFVSWNWCKTHPHIVSLKYLAINNIDSLLITLWLIIYLVKNIPPSLTNASCSRKNIPWFQLHQVSMISALTLSVPFIMWQSPWISQGACFSSENKSDQYDTMYKSNIVGSGIKHQIYINL